MKLILDLDNVFIDFIRAIIKLHSFEIDYMDCTCDMAQIMYPDDHNKFWEPVTQEWWANLPWTPEGSEFYNRLFNYCDVDDMCIATALPTIESKYVYGTGYYDGRMQWIEKHMPEIKHISLTTAKHFKASPDTILIDDMDHNCEKFLAKGGKTFTPSRPWNRYRNKETFDVTAALRTIRDMGGR